jgi:hypothetical protein
MRMGINLSETIIDFDKYEDVVKAYQLTPEKEYVLVHPPNFARMVEGKTVRYIMHEIRLQGVIYLLIIKETGL